MNTFWRPIKFNENIDTEYEKDKYRMNLIEKTKKLIAHENMEFTDSKMFEKAVEDETEHAKYNRTMLGFYNHVDEQEEIVFKKLIPNTEKTSDDIMRVIPEKIRTTFQYI